MQKELNFLSEDYRLSLRGPFDDAVSYIVVEQLKNREYWKKYVEVFRNKEDIEDLFWRCEYFGKQMRGACLIYAYRHDEELYGILREAVLDLLSTQDEEGRISTYTKEKEFQGWDMWGRKYVLTGLMHFASICREDDLKKKVIEACQRQLDYIVSHIGPGKVDILQTSSFWGALPSATILEPTLDLYSRTGKKEYLEFARYIISTGGCNECNLVSLIEDTKKFPYEFPVTKAYEMMSFFEGLLAYYEVTGEERYLHIVQEFVRRVHESDITVIGCAGCTHELFDHSAAKQSEFAENIMQETCVTVTWMRLLTRLAMDAPRHEYFDWIETSALNALYGSFNVHHEEQWHMFEKKWWDAAVVDSYSPLYMNSRGRGIGGAIRFRSGGYCGCCIAIVSAGIALMPLDAVMAKKDGSLLLNYPFEGSLTRSGEAILSCHSDYPRSGKLVVESKVDVIVRVPAWAKEEAKEILVKAGEKREFDFPMSLNAFDLNGKRSYSYGPLVLASEQRSNDRPLETPIEQDAVLKEVDSPDAWASFDLTDSRGTLHLWDYVHAGKRWRDGKGKMSVFFPLRK